MTRSRSVILATGAVPILALAIGGLVRLPTWLAYNATPSAPIGFYTLDRPRRFGVGDRVLARLPSGVAQLADRRGYVPASVPVLKRLAAGPGGVVCRRAGLVTVDGAPVAVARERDRLGRPLPVWSGCRQITADEVFLLSGANPAAFDGRYFGPSSASLILARAHPLWTW